MHLDDLYKQVEALSNEHREKLHTIQTDKRLSNSGKQEKLTEAQEEFQGKIKTIQDKYINSHNEVASLHLKTLNGNPKTSLSDKVKAKARQDSSLYDVSISDDMKSAVHRGYRVLREHD